MSSESKNGKVAEMPSVNHAASDGGLMMTHDGIELANMSVEALKQLFERGRSLKAAGLVMQAMAFGELGRRGIDVREYEEEEREIWTAIYAGQLAAEVIAVAKIPWTAAKRLLGMPLDQQREYAAGRRLVQLVDKEKPNAVATMPLNKLSPGQIMTAFCRGKALTQDEQRQALRARIDASKPASKKITCHSYDIKTGSFKHGYTKIIAAEVIECIARGMGPDLPPGDRPEERMKVSFVMHPDQAKKFFERCSKQGLDQGEVIRVALRAAGFPA
jgi:hypothetical protein